MREYNEGLLYPAYIAIELRKEYKKYKARGGTKSYSDWVEAKTTQSEYKEAKQKAKDLRKANKELSNDKFLEEAFLEGYYDALFGE